MNSLIDNPAIQAGAIPALAGFIVSALLLRTRMLVLVPLTALVVVATLVLGWSMHPLTTVSKVVLSSFGFGALALALELLMPMPGKSVRAFLAISATAAAIWVASRALGQLPGSEVLFRAALIAVVVVLTVSGFSRTGADPLKSLIAACVLGFTSGFLVFLGASTSLAFIGIGIGAASGVAALMQMSLGRGPATVYLLLPVLAFASLAPAIAHLTGGLTWLALLPLPLVAPAAALISATERPVWQQAMLSGLPALVPSFLALALAWFRVGAATT